MWWLSESITMQEVPREPCSLKVLCMPSAKALLNLSSVMVTTKRTVVSV